MEMINTCPETSGKSLPFLFLSNSHAAMICSIPINFEAISSSAKLSPFKSHSDKPKKQSNPDSNNVNMQSRLAEATRRSYCLLSSTCSRFPLKRGFCAANRSQTADPDIHSGEQKPGYTNYRDTPQGTSTDDSAPNAKFAETDRVPNKEEIFESPKSPCEPSVKLKSTGVNQRLDPNIQQKRKQGTIALEEVSCAGLDGSPWPQEKKEEENIREEQREDNRDYYKHHKASPLSELEFADTRKPVSRAMQGTADSGKGGDVIGWLPEQLETAEETLMRAAKLWRQTAMRGDPDAPHSRVLRALRGEDF